MFLFNTLPWVEDVYESFKRLYVSDSSQGIGNKGKDDRQIDRQIHYKHFFECHKWIIILTSLDSC